MLLWLYLLLLLLMVSFVFALLYLFHHFCLSPSVGLPSSHLDTCVQLGTCTILFFRTRLPEMIENKKTQFYASRFLNCEKHSNTYETDSARIMESLQRVAGLSSFVSFLSGLLSLSLRSSLFSLSLLSIPFFSCVNSHNKKAPTSLTLSITQVAHRDGALDASVLLLHR